MRFSPPRSIHCSAQSGTLLRLKALLGKLELSLEESEKGRCAKRHASEIVQV